MVLRFKDYFQTCILMEYMIYVKLKLSGKINSSNEKIWSVIGYSCANPLLRLKLTISDGVDTYKIFYSEEVTQYRGNKIPKISAVSSGLFTRFSLKISGLESICFFENEENIIPLIKIAS